MNTTRPSRVRADASALLVVLILVGSTLRAADWPQWRGPQRDGISSESGLLAQWPDGGPKLLWQKRDVGTGYSTPAVVGERLYLLGNDGLNDEFVAAHAVRDGRRIWRTRLGKVGNPDQKPEFPAARSTPTVDGDVLYALGSDGDLACVETKSGEVRWRKSLRTDFGGKPGNWAYTESPLVDGGTLVCTPGGAAATIVALDNKTGEVIWKTAVPQGDAAAYASAIVVDAAGIKQYVQMLHGGLVGLDARTGKLLWRYAKTVSKYNANIPTPVARGDLVYCAGAGTGGGAVKLTAAGGAVKAEQVYFSPKLPTAIGGCVLVGDHLYGTGSQGVLCIEFGTGEIRWQDRSVGAASLCYAGGRLYLHGEQGAVALVEPNPAEYREKGRFTPPGEPERRNQMERAWAYPVVANGRLYLRDHHQLWCYDVKAPSPAE